MSQISALVHRQSEYHEYHELSDCKTSHLFGNARFNGRNSSHKFHHASVTSLKLAKASEKRRAKIKSLNGLNVKEAQRYIVPLQIYLFI